MQVLEERSGARRKRDHPQAYPQGLGHMWLLNFFVSHINLYLFFILSLRSVMHALVAPIPESSSMLTSSYVFPSYI